MRAQAKKLEKMLTPQFAFLKYCFWKKNEGKNLYWAAISENSEYSLQAEVTPTKYKWYTNMKQETSVILLDNT